MAKIDDVIQKFEAKEGDTKILLVGQTGAGKTTLLNYLARVADTADLGMKEITGQHIHNLINGHVADEANEGESGEDSGMSQTQKPKEYEIPITSKSGRTISLLVMDMPGFADTSGVGVDKIHERNIVDCIAQQGFVTCILFVISGAVPRITATTKYTMALLTSLFPRDILQNVVIVHTFVSAKERCRFPEGELVESFDELPKRFYLENPLAFLMGCEKDSGAGSAVRAIDKIDWSEDEDDDPDGEQGRQMCRLLKKSNRAAVNILDAIADFPSYPTNSIIELSAHKDRITNVLLELRWAIKSEVDIQKRIDAAEARRQRKEDAQDEYQEKWVLKDSPDFHYYCEDVGCSVGGRPCCFRMEAGHGQYDSELWSNVKWAASMGIFRSKLDKDKEAANLAGKEAGKDKVFHCECRHPISQHIGGKKEWELQRELLIRKEDLSPDEEASAERLREERRRSVAKLLGMRQEIKEALEGYGRLGLPSAMQKLMNEMKMSYDELIAANGDDSKYCEQLHGFLSDVEVMQGLMQEQMFAAGASPAAARGRAATAPLATAAAVPSPVAAAPPVAAPLAAAPVPPVAPKVTAPDALSPAAEAAPPQAVAPAAVASVVARPEVAPPPVAAPDPAAAAPVAPVEPPPVVAPPQVAMPDPAAAVAPAAAAAPPSAAVAPPPAASPDPAATAAAAPVEPIVSAAAAADATWGGEHTYEIDEPRLQGEGGWDHNGNHKGGEKGSGGKYDPGGYHGITRRGGGSAKGSGGVDSGAGGGKGLGEPHGCGGRGMIIPRDTTDSVTDAVDKLISGALDCPDGFCVVWSASSQGFFCVHRSDKLEAARAKFPAKKK